MEFLNKRYVKIYKHKGIDICTLKVACPADADSLGYVIDDERFEGCVYNHLEDAIAAINEAIKG